MSFNNMRWELKTFKELSANDLFEYLRLRQAVFVVEQACAYPDIDNKDTTAHHVLVWHEHTLAACARIIPAGISYDQPSIGRIATSIEYRGTGLGRELVGRCINHTQALHPEQAIKIGAQQRLERFYQSFGFKTVSKMYLEDDIEHIDMLLN